MLKCPSIWAALVKPRILKKVRDWQTGVLEAVVRGNPGLGLDRRAELLVSLFENDIPARSRVLDIGGRWGFYAGPLARRGHCPVILDVVRPRLQNAPVVLYDGRTMPFPDKSFDVSLLITVLHHIADMDRVVQEARRVTRGQVIVVEDLYHHPLGRFWTVVRDSFYNFEWIGHPRGFKTRPQWEAYFKNAGLKLRSCREVFTRLCGLRILNGIFVLEAGR